MCAESRSSAALSTEPRDQSLKHHSGGCTVTESGSRRTLTLVPDGTCITANGATSGGITRVLTLDDATVVDFLSRQGSRTSMDRSAGGAALVKGPAPYGECAICEGPLPYRPGAKRVICDQKECRSEVSRYAGRIGARRRKPKPLVSLESHRECKKCGVVKPLDSAHFHDHKRNGRQTFERKCRECVNAERREQYVGAEREKRRAYQNEQRRLRKLAMEANAEYATEVREAANERKRKWRQENKEQARELAKRYRENRKARMKADPALRQEFLENRRIAKRMRAERNGKKLELMSQEEYNKRYGNGYSKGTPLLVAPLVGPINKWLREYGGGTNGDVRIHNQMTVGRYAEDAPLLGAKKALAQLAGTSEKRLGEITSGRQTTASIVTVANLCDALGLVFGDVYGDVP